MDIERWKPGRQVSPLRRLRSLEDDMESIMERFFGEAFSPAAAEGIWAPVVDVKNRKKDVVVKAELPEIDAKDVDITVDGDILTIKGERKAEEEKEEENYYYAERSYGSFARAIRLPSAVDESKTKANYKNGLLTITLPKKEEEKAKQVKVDVE